MITPRAKRVWRIGRARVVVTLARCYCPCHNAALGVRRDDPQEAAVASGCWCVDYHCPALETPESERPRTRTVPQRALAAWDARWGEPRPSVQPPPPAEAAGGTDEDDGN